MNANELSNEEFGEFVLFMRNAIGFSQEKMAKKLSMPLKTYKSLEKGADSIRNGRFVYDAICIEYDLRNIVKKELQKQRLALKSETTQSMKKGWEKKYVKRKNTSGFNRRERKILRNVE